MSEDEYDKLPDVFEGVDWDSLAIPALSSSIPHTTPPSQTMALPRESTESANENTRSPTSSEEYPFEDVDQAFLDQVSAVEAEFYSQELQQTGAVQWTQSQVVAKSLSPSVIMTGTPGRV